MENLIIYCKSFNKDINRFSVLLESLKKYNTQNLKFYTSVPESDISLFKNKFGTDYVNIISDEEIYNNLPSMRGWEQQQVVKSSFWKLNICKNYLMIDSDSYFIKPFKQEDFLYSDDIPYTVIHEQKELFS